MCFINITLVIKKPCGCSLSTTDDVERISVILSRKTEFKTATLLLETFEFSNWAFLDDNG